MNPRHPKLSETLGARWGRSLAKRRRDLGLSQVQLADLADVTQQSISAIELGVLIPTDNLKVILASKLGTTPQALFAWPPMSELVAA